MADGPWLPRIRPEVTLKRDEVRGEDLVIQPERLGRLNESAAAILRLCDGTRTVDEICAALQADHPATPLETIAASVDRFLASARSERWIR